MNMKDEQLLKEKRKTPAGHAVCRRLFLLSVLSSFVIVFSYSQTYHVVLVIIDGARYTETLGDPLGQYTPRMNQLAHQGMVVDTFLNDMYTYTSRAIPAIWCGSWSSPNDTTVDGQTNQYATVPTVWEYFRKSTGEAATQAFYIMKSVSAPWIQSYYPGYGPDFWPAYICQGSSDLNVWQNTRTRLQAYRPALTVVYLADVDQAGHTGVWTEYTTALLTADSIVGMVWDLIQTDPTLKNRTTLFVTNDHGRHSEGTSSGFKGHGDDCQGCRRIMFLGLGYRMPKGVRSGRHTIPDITPTIGALLGFPTPYASGSPMTDILTSVENASSQDAQPAAMALEQNYPNPFNPETAIRYSLIAGNQVRLSVFDLLGREVAILVNENKPAGTHAVRWNADTFPSGIYAYRLTAGGSSGVKRMILLK
jgi:hypothetical protein